MGGRAAGARPSVLVVYHRASTFGGSFNSVLDVLARVDRSKFSLTGALPGDGNCRERFEAAGVPTVLAAEHPGGRSPRYLLSVAGWMRWLRRLRCDLLYVSDYVTWRSSALMAARLLGRASVVHVRAPLRARPMDPELGRSTLVVGNSQASVQAIAPQRPPGSTRVVYNFVDIDRFSSGKDIREAFFPDRPRVVGFVGVFRPEKGIEYFLDMATSLRRSRPDVRFLAVGGESTGHDVGWFAHIRRRAAELGLDDVMAFTGARQDVPDIMKSIDVLVVPSFNEGFGRVVIEANAAGIPVVGADAAGLPEVIEPGVTGFLVPPRDAAALQACVERVLDDEDWRRQVATSAPARVRSRFDPDQQMRQLAQAWEDAISMRQVS